MLLYYCTICALYPSLYTSNLSSSVSSIRLDETPSDSSFNLYDFQNKRASEASSRKSNLDRRLSIEFSIDQDLETTSEGLCDHVREIFGINRQMFNEYQVKAMRKLLYKKLHAQVSN